MSEEEITTEKAGPSRPAFVYILECADGSLYTGWTWNVQARLKIHNAGRGAKYTRSRLPVSLVYLEQLPNEKAARQREYAIKQLPRDRKLQIIHTKLSQELTST